jgi:alpha-ketoglutarate-dependent taurine dioxygenase
VASPPNTIDDVGSSLTAEHISGIRRFLRADGYAYLHAMTSEFDHFSELLRLGEYVKQYEGRLIRDVQPDPKLADAPISASNMKALSPHTESFEFDEVPPRYVALWCVRPAAGSGGETTLADAHQFLREFSEPDIRLMHSRIYEWRSPGSLSREGITMSARHPILEQQPDALLMRYSSREMYQVGAAEDDLGPRYVEGGIRFFDATRMEISIERHAMLIWDNWRMIHSRNAFTDPRRHLRRVLLNSRRAEPADAVHA